MNFNVVRLLPVILVFVLGCLWGLHFSLIKICSESGLSHIGILVFTTIGVAAAFTAFSLLRSQLPRFRLSDIRFYVSCALLGYVGPIMVELSVAQHMDAGVLTLIVSTTPLFTLLFATLIKSESISAKGILGIGIGCGAIILLLLPKLLPPNQIGVQILTWQTVALTFVVPVSYGIYHNYVYKAWPPNSNTWQVACGEMLVALLMLLPLLLWQWTRTNTSSSAFFADGWQAVHWALVVIVVFAVLEVFLYFEIVRLAGAVTVSLSNFVTIAAGIVWGMLIFNERPGWWQWFCVALLMLALFLVLNNRRQINFMSPAQTDKEQ